MPNKDGCSNCGGDVTQHRIGDLEHAMRTARQVEETNHKNHGERLRAIEDWKLVFVTKFTAKLSMISAIALFVGTIVSQLLISYLKSSI